MHEQVKDWIPLKDCVHDGLYRIHARNFSLGIYDKEQKAFLGKRTKFDAIYLWPEDHWDTGEPYGTVKPIKLLEMYEGDEPKMEYLKRKEKEYNDDQDQ